MLTELSIRNYALIENLRLDFSKGLNVLTGETGAGKSIIIDALSLVLGAKAGASSLKKDAQRGEITGAFDLKRNKPARKFLKELSLENADDEDLLIIRREFDAQGKSRAWVNDRPVQVGTLAELGEFLVEIHGQHDHQRLLKSAEHRELLDRYGDHGELREEVAGAFREWKELVAEQSASRLSESERAQKIDLYRFQAQEIESAKLAHGEDEEIDRILPQMKNAGKLRVQADEIHTQLYEDEGAAEARLLKSKKAMDALLAFGADLKDAPAMLEEALIRVREVSGAVDAFRQNLSADPQKIDALLSRQDLIEKLKKKYGSDITAILGRLEELKAELDALENHSARAGELEKKISEARAQLLKSGRKLSAARKKASEKLSALVEKELKDLGFPKGRFAAQLVPEKDAEGNEAPSAAGLEKVEFLFSANPGEDPKPLKQVASGGELSRIMLALKKILAELDLVPTVIFDEIDNGVGGSMGHVIGEKLKGLSRALQVVLITHLPQIAAFAEKQFSVQKSVAGQKTLVKVEPVEDKNRVREIARMLGGVSGGNDEPTRASLEHASELLQHAN